MVVTMALEIIGDRVPEGGRSIPTMRGEHGSLVLANKAVVFNIVDYM